MSTSSILFLSKAPPYVGTGAEKVIWDLGNHLSKNDWDVHFLCPDGDPPRTENMTFHEVSTPDSFFLEKASFFVRGIREFTSVVDDIDPDVIYDNSSPFPFIYTYLTERDRTVTKVHAIYGLSALRNKDHPITKIGTIVGEQLYRGLDGNRLVTVSESTKERLSKLVLRNERDITVVRNGIEPTRFDYQFSREGPVLCLAALTPRKNVSTLLSAWKLLERNGVEKELLIAGDGPKRKELETLSRELSIENVTFLGYVSEDEKRELLSDAFIYVLPTRLEGFGLSNMEAMASGCIVVSTQTWGVKDYLSHGENGFTVPIDDPQQLSNQLEEVLNHVDRERLEQIAQHGRDTAESHDVRTSVERERKMLEQLSEPNGSSANLERSVRK